MIRSQHRHFPAHQGRVHRAFTLIELLVVIAVIALLIGILLPTLAKVRQSGRTTKETSLIRQLGIAHSIYANDNKEALLPAYLRASWADPAKGGFLVHDNGQDASQESRITGSIIRPYPWRIYPYVNYSPAALVADRNWLSRIGELPHDRTDIGGYEYTIARNPGFGLNGTFVGGDSHRGAFFLPSFARWGKFYMTRMDEARQTDKLISFATSRGVHRNNNGVVVPGYHRIEAPWHSTPTSNSIPAWIPWLAPRGGFDPTQPTDAYGHVDFRNSGKTIVVTLDGHA